MSNNTNFDFDFINKLFQTFPHPEGSTFADGWKVLTKDDKNEVHKRALEKFKPERVLEFGTHKAEYGYLLKTFHPEVKELVTVCQLPESKQCTDLVNEYFQENFIQFIEGRIPEVWETVSLEGKFNLGWLDAGHCYDLALGDLRKMKELDIPVILMDDSDMESVQLAMKTFLEESPEYQLQEDTAGIYWVEKSGSHLC